MRKYVATPGAEVIGIAMNNWFVSINRDEFLPLVKQTLDQYSIHKLEDDKWYPHQISLDIFRLIDAQKTSAADSLVALGMAYVETAVFPPEINSTLSGLMALSLTYHLNIRNVPKTEGYEVSQISDKHIQIKDENPFPHDTVYGFVWGIAKRFKTSKDGFALIKRTFCNPDDPDADGAIYDVTLE
ncbi:MAG: hypothetical protein ABI947_10345 [Chloroflexota bacterium]